MPASRVPSTTSSAPTLCSFIVREASSTVADLGAVIGFCLATIVRSERMGIGVSWGRRRLRYWAPAANPASIPRPG